MTISKKRFGTNNIIPSIPKYPVHFNIHLDILIIPLYAYE